jgi:hypothetical protein
LKIEIFFSIFTIALICFQSQYFVHFEISNNIIGEDRSEGWREIFMFIKRGHALRKVEKHWYNAYLFPLKVLLTLLGHHLV